MTTVKERYSSVSIALHWLMVILIAATYACIEFREMFPKGSDPRNALKALHFMLGLSVFFLVGWRIAARIFSPNPAIIPSIPPWQQKLATLGHITLYVFMIGMPLAGWLILSAEGKTIPFWGIELPPLTAPDKDLAHTIEDWHETIGELGYFLIGGHALAALSHHYLRKNNALKRMWFKTQKGSND